MEGEAADRKFTCTEHNKPIEAFCRNHVTDVCSYCIAVKHVICDVDTWAKDLDHEMQNLSKQLFKATEVQEKLNSILQNSSQNKDNIHEELKTKVLHVLSLLEKRLLECLEKECNEQFSVAEKRNSKCSKDASDAEVQLQCLNDLRHTSYADVKSGIEQAKETRRKLQLAVLEAEGCATLERIKTNVLNTLKKSSRNQINQFKETVFLSAENVDSLSDMPPISSDDINSKPKDEVIKTEKSFSSSLLSSFEVISLTESSLPMSDDAMTRSKNQPNGLNLIAGFDAKRANDEMKCWLTGATFLYDDRIVLGDRNNSKLKLFSKDLKFLDSVPVDGKPFDVTQTDYGTVAVSLPEQQKIRFYEVEEFFAVDKILKEIDTRQPCYGLAHHDGNLYVVCLTTFSQQGCLKIYNAKGDIINHITQTEDGLDFLGSLKIAISPETKQIYFRELSWTTWKVRITEEKAEASNVGGSKSIVFQGCPIGFAAAKDGAFVANIQTNSIQWIDSHSDKVFDIKHLRTEFFFPFALALNKDCSRLLATNSHLLLNLDDNNIVRVFDVVRDD